MNGAAPILNEKFYSGTYYPTPYPANNDNQYQYQGQGINFRSGYGLAQPADFTSVLSPVNKLISHYAPSSSSSSHSYDSHYSSRPSSFNISYWNWGTTNNYQSGSSSNDRNIGLGIVISLVAIGVGFFVGKELGNVENAGSAIRKLSQLQDYDLTENQASVVRYAKSVITDTKASAVKSAILKISALAGLVIASVGAFISGGGSLIALGLVVTLISTLALVIQAGVNYSTDFNAEKYQELLKVSKQLNELVQSK